MRLILASRDDWLLRRGIQDSDPDWCQQLGRLPAADQEPFRRLFAIEFNRQLDQLARECLLKRSELAKVVTDSLHHFDGERYLLGGIVVMANHVHALACAFPQYSMLGVCYS